MTRCRICENTENNTAYRAREMMFGLREEFDYFECGQCGCLQIREIPEDMSPYYPPDYYSFDFFTGEKFKGAGGLVRNAKNTLALLGMGPLKNVLGMLSGLGLDKKSRILDVGCGNGKNFLYPLAALGYTNLLGCDLYLDKPLTYPNGLQIKDCPVFDLTEKQHVITYHHAFEHLPDPLANLEKVYELLLPGGMCIIRIPIVSSHAWKHYGTDWVQLDAPRHFFLHSVESMELLAQKSGLLMDRIVYDSTYFQFVGSEKYKRNIPLKEEGTGTSRQERKRLKRKYKKDAARLNAQQLGDQAAFFLKKP